MAKVIQKVIINLGLWKASGPDSIPVVVLKNCEPELSYMLAELFTKCLRESYFPDFWEFLSVVPVFKNVGERSTAKNYHPVSILFVVSKVFEKLVNNRPPWKMWPFLWFPVWLQVFSINCRSSYNCIFENCLSF